MTTTVYFGFWQNEIQRIKDSKQFCTSFRLLLSLIYLSCSGSFFYKMSDHLGVSVRQPCCPLSLHILLWLSDRKWLYRKNWDLKKRCNRCRSCSWFMFCRFAVPLVSKPPLRICHWVTQQAVPRPGSEGYGVWALWKKCHKDPRDET